MRASRLAPLACCALLASCFEDPPVIDPRCPDGGCRTDDLGGDVALDRAPAPDAAPDRPAMDAALDARDGGACTESQPCPGGLCLNGSCCPSTRVCGGACCGAAQTCFANACVTPGAACVTSADCGAGAYCEPSLGGGASGDGGVPDAGDGGTSGRVCTTPLPTPGRCLTLPPRCPEADGGAAPDAGGGGCIARCEYRPPVGALEAEAAWSWGQPRPPSRFPEHVDVWSTPAVGRVYDANCDGRVDALDPPDVVFVSGRSVHAMTGLGTCCQCNATTPTACATGVLRVVDGRTGAELLSLDRASAMSAGFSGISVALGDLDNDRDMDVAAVTGEGYVVVLDGAGRVLMTSDRALPGAGTPAFGWGGGLAIADMNRDGLAEVAYGATVFGVAGGRLVHRFTGTAGIGGGNASQAVSTFADVDNAADLNLELVAGRAVYRADGTTLWARSDLPDGFPAVADFDGDGMPEVVLVGDGQAWVLNGATGATRLGPLMLPGTGSGGPPTVADFDGDRRAEIGVAQANYYAVLEPDLRANTFTVLWRAANHDLSSSVTGSTVFDFEGDGAAEVIYADECFVWVFDGRTGAVRWTGLTTSFTGTEASVVADVDGDGHAEIVVVSNGADPSAMGWRCDIPPWNLPDLPNRRLAWAPPAGQTAWRGVRVFRDVARSWVGTRPLWNQHTYHVSNVCLASDDACTGAPYDGQIPRLERRNWAVPWLNNFRQNVQQSGLFSAPDATVTLSVTCAIPPTLVATVRNLGEATLPAGVRVEFFARGGDGGETSLGAANTNTTLFPGAAQELRLTAPPGASPEATYVARIVTDPMRRTFRECREDNNASAPTRAPCPG
ncbi:MAG: FG-GAP-like repeat-containing protein [Polyangiales bacterium]